MVKILILKLYLRIAVFFKDNNFDLFVIPPVETKKNDLYY